uniref:Actin-like protein ARPC3 n=1 Tax=Metchnikovella dogieli TaxID=2804710 RepID=A0A896WNG1_9MICR|nr:actin-like protein ARPC3 [Metchnikovella dogieli]
MYADAISDAIARACCLTAGDPEHPTVERCPAEHIVVEGNAERTVLEMCPDSLRISLDIRKADCLLRFICRRFCSFMMKRAEALCVLRRKPVHAHDISFLLTAAHTTAHAPAFYPKRIAAFAADINRAISEMKLEANARTRAVAAEFFSCLGC